MHVAIHLDEAKIQDFKEEEKRMMCEIIKHVGGIVTLFSPLSAVLFASLLEKQVIEDSD